jgi:hypothetical protein
MAFFPKDSAIQVPAGSDLEKAIASASSVSEIQTLLHEAARAQKLIEPDPFDRDGQDWFSHHAVETPQPKGFAKTVTLDGKKHILQSDTEDGLVQEEIRLMRDLFAGRQAETQQRDSAGRFIAQPPTQEEMDAEAARVAALNVDPAAAALAPSVTAALQAAGIDVAALRELTQTKQNEAYINAWAGAATAFGEAHPEYPASEANKNILARFISENNLLDAEDKEGALEAAYTFAVENQKLVETTEAKQARAAEEQDRAINEAKTPEDLQQLLRSKGHLAPLNSSYWGR